MSGNSSTKSLALLVSHDSITFLTKTDQHEEVFYSEPSHIKLEDLNQSVSYERIENEIKSNLPLLLYYNRIIVCYQSTPTVVVPKAYISRDQEDVFISKPQNFQNLLNLTSIDASIAYNNYGNLFKVFKNLANFSNAIYTHSAKMLIENQEIDKENIQVFGQIINQKLELCIYNKGVFTLYNIYDIIGDEDVVYHILNTIQQLQLDQSQVVVSFKGGIDYTHVALEHLPKYVHNVSIDNEAHAQGPKYLLYKIFECE